MSVKLYLGDCLDVIGLPDNSVDAVVTDPPYGLGKTLTLQTRPVRSNMLYFHMAMGFWDASPPRRARRCSISAISDCVGWRWRCPTCCLGQEQVHSSGHAQDLRGNCDQPIVFRTRQA